MRISGKLCIRRNTMGDTSKANIGRLSRLGIDHTIAHIKHIFLTDMQAIQSYQYAFRRRFGSRDIFTTHNKVEHIVQSFGHEQLTDAIAKLRRDDTQLCTTRLQPTKHAFHFGEKYCIGRHIDISFLHVLTTKFGQAGNIRTAIL